MNNHEHMKQVELKGECDRNGKQLKAMSTPYAMLSLACFYAYACVILHTYPVIVKENVDIHSNYILQDIVHTVKYTH